MTDEHDILTHPVRPVSDLCVSELAGSSDVPARWRAALTDAANTAPEPPADVTDRILAALQDAPGPGNSSA